MTEPIILIDPDGNTIDIEVLISSIVKKIAEEGAIEKSSGKTIITAYIEKLMEKEDPLISSFATLGGEQLLNAVGILLFIAFQMGYVVSKQNYSLKSTDSK